MKIDLTWGESIAVRQAFLEQVKDFVFITKLDLAKLNYTPFEGNEKLIEFTREVIKRQTGLNYKHIILTNGTTGGLRITLTAYRLMGYKDVATDYPPFFRLYPNIIESAGLRHLYDLRVDSTINVKVIDSPRNPTGQILVQDSKYSPVIWDAVYSSRVYTDQWMCHPKHDVITASYSKLTGLNGIRIGWVATNDDMLADRLKFLVAGEYCGLSAPSTEILLQLLPDYNWELFELSAKNKLDRARTEWSKLEKYFQGQPVSPNGMFYYARMDDACKKLFNKANVEWSLGSKLHDSDDFGRFNIGQDPDHIVEAVKRIIKLDRA